MSAGIEANLEAASRRNSAGYIFGFSSGASISDTAAGMLPGKSDSRARAAGEGNRARMQALVGIRFSLIRVLWKLVDLIRRGHILQESISGLGSWRNLTAYLCFRLKLVLTIQGVGSFPGSLIFGGIKYRRGNRVCNRFF